MSFHEKSIPTIFHCAGEITSLKKSIRRVWRY